MSIASTRAAGPGAGGDPAGRKGATVGGSGSWASLFRRTSFVIPAVFVLVVLTGYPLYQVVQMTLFDFSDPTAPRFSGLTNFQRVLERSDFWTALTNTLVLTFASVALCLLGGLALAMALSQPINRRFGAVLRSVYMFPWLFSSAVVGALWVMMLNPFGLINHLLGLVGLTSLADTAWLSEPGVAMAGLVAANVWRSLPFTMLMLLAGMQTVPKDLLEAASIDGANAWQRLRKVTLPHLRPIILTVTTLDTVWNFRSFDLVYIMTAGGPMGSTETLSTFVYNEAFRGLDFGTASAAALILFVVMLTVSFAYLRTSVPKEDN